MIRSATSLDISAVVDLEQTLFGLDAWSEDQVVAELTGPGRKFVVAEHAGGDILGYVVTRTAGEVVDLMRIGVRPDVHRRGLASGLLDVALEGTDDAARMLLEVSVLNPAVAFYVARQFSVIDVRPNYYRDGSEALVMCRWLPAANKPQPAPDEASRP